MRLIQNLIIVVVSTLLVTGQTKAVTGADDEKVLGAFSNFVAESDLDDDAKKEVAEIIEEYGKDSAADAITESLIAMNEGYGDAVEASDDDDTEATINALQPFTESNNNFLAADSSFYLARALMNAEQYEMAKPLLVRVHSEWSEFSVHVGKAKFYLGVAQAGLLDYTGAVETLTEFAESYPDAPERLRVAAWRQIQQLRSIQAGKMEDVYQRMDFSRRKLSLIEPGEKTQQEQQKIVNMLAKLIKEQEKKEASQSQSKDQKNTNQKPESKPGQQSGQQEQGKSDKGGTSNNPNGKVVKKAYDNGPASPWSRLRDRSRDPANNAIKDKLPARYRDIVERYYEAANGDSKK